MMNSCLASNRSCDEFWNPVPLAPKKFDGNCSHDQGHLGWKRSPSVDTASVTQNATIKRSIDIVPTFFYKLICYSFDYS
eukprot:m.87219 g.87219  ORF g.87219 m.87219 type:complete len:79 (+) comp13095_c0_seq4:2246-2482(+)